MPTNNNPSIKEVMAREVNKNNKEFYDEAQANIKKNEEHYYQKMLEEQQASQQGQFFSEQKQYRESSIAQYGESSIAKMAKAQKMLTENAKVAIRNKPPKNAEWARNSQSVPCEDAQEGCDNGCYDIASDDDVITLNPPPCGNTVTASPGSYPTMGSDQGYPVGYTTGKKIKERPIMADTMIGETAMPEDVDIFKTHMIIEKVNEKLNITVIAVDKDKAENNSVTSIRSYGDSLGGYAYDTGSDSYLVSCAGHINLGSIPLVLRMAVPGHVGKMLVPLPEALIYKFMSPQQKRLMRVFGEKHFGCEIQFIQSLSRA